tara:strand:- start:1849 stop:2466 length:618 start_codon:yes stop_codon:yes gene_type:complete
MPRRSKRRTRRKRGGLGDKECNEIAHAICGDVTKFNPTITPNDPNAQYATRVRQENFPCTLVVDDAGNPILKEDKDKRRKDPKTGKVRMLKQYVDEDKKPCSGDSYLASVPSRNIEDCKRDKHGYGSSQVFKDCHWDKKQSSGHFYPATYLKDRENLAKYRTDYSLVGLGGRRRRRRKKSRKKRRKSKRKKSRRKRKRSRRRRRR